MGYLVFSAIFLFAVAGATVVQKLTYPQFLVGKTQLYDLTINMTAGIQGMRPQVSKAVLTAELKIYAKTKTELILSAENVYVSGSQANLSSANDFVVLKHSKNLEDHLKLPFKCRYEYGKVRSFSLDPKETLESQKIKRTILRSLELYLDKKVLRPPLEGKWPATYNITKTSPTGNFSAHYVITSSPYDAFPRELKVFNITRTDNYEVVPYDAYETHRNFETQGCADVCKQAQLENKFDAGCPVGYESYHTPMKKSFLQQHDLRILQNGVLIIDKVTTIETHVADVYDQNMEVYMSSVLRFKVANLEKIKERKSTTAHSNLDDFSTEINENEIAKLCGHSNSIEALKVSKTLLQELAEIVVKADLRNKTSSLVGEKVFLLRKALMTLKQIDLRHLEETIVSYHSLPTANDIDRVKRQIWLDLLPVIGTEDSISFITNIIQENANKPNKDISLWEAASVLGALPMNILQITDRILIDLSRLLELVSERDEPGYTVFYSASYLTVARTIYRACAVKRGIPRAKEPAKKTPFDELNLILQRLSLKRNKDPQFTCPKATVNRFIDDVENQLKSTDDKAKRAVYIETLARTGLQEVLPHLLPYIYGKVSDLSPSYVDFLKVVTIKSLHNLVGLHPLDVQHLVLPIYLNRTEPSKVRIAAFAVFIKTNPSLGILQEIAQKTWAEKSLEVGSFVTSTLEAYANASLPCLQLIAHRIKLVLPQAKQFHVGLQYSKNFRWDVFDEGREFGLSKTFMYAASNESIIPSILYGALSYYDRSFSDHFYQYAVTSQGLSANKLLDHLYKFFDTDVSESIPKYKERSLFPKVQIMNRDSESWRMTMYHKMFYAVYYNYFDEEDVKYQEFMSFVKDYFLHYFKRDSKGAFEGHLVRLFVPSSYRTVAIGHAIPNPIQFERENLLLFSVKVSLKEHKVKSSKQMKLSVEPSAYFSTLYTNQILNLRDCKNVGVYHTSKTFSSHSIEMEIAQGVSGTFNVSYRFPSLPKQTFSFQSEAGTYAGAQKIDSLPVMENKAPILTVPYPFKKNITRNIFGMPPASVLTLSENIMEGEEDAPKHIREAVLRFIKQYRDAGWRRKSINVTLLPVKDVWSTNTTGFLRIQYNRHFGKTVLKPSTHFGNLMHRMRKPCFIRSTTSSSEALLREKQIIQETLAKDVAAFLEDKISIDFKQMLQKRIVSTASVKYDYNHTFCGRMHVLEASVAAKDYNMSHPLEASFTFTGVILGGPNVFKYNDSSYDKQDGLVGTRLSFGRTGPYANFTILVGGGLQKELLNKTLNNELEYHLGNDFFMPETHDACIDDVKEGNGYSVACIKAIRDRSVFNKWAGNVWFNDKLPAVFNGIVKTLESTLKTNFDVAQYFAHKEGRFSVPFNATYIDKLTDDAVFDVIVNNTDGVVRRKIRAALHPPYSTEKMIETFNIRLTNNSYPATCALMDKYITTYDMVNYPLPRDIQVCTYILSAHCVQHKKFAVLAKINTASPGARGAEEIHMHLGKDVLILTPRNKTGVYKLKFNEQYFTLTPLMPVTLSMKKRIFAYLLDEENGILQVEAGHTGIRAVYNGHNILLKVSAKYKGELCGLCSDFNGETIKEYRGVGGCIFSDSTDFAKNSILGSCVDKTPVNPMVCKGNAVSATPYESAPLESSDIQNDDSEAWTVKTVELVMRNLILSRDGELCFSNDPFPACDGNKQPTETEDADAEFICYQKGDPEAKRLLRDSTSRILTELAYRKCDFLETVAVATRC